MQFKKIFISVFVFLVHKPLFCPERVTWLATPQKDYYVDEPPIMKDVQAVLRTAQRDSYEALFMPFYNSIRTHIHLNKEVLPILSDIFFSERTETLELTDREHVVIELMRKGLLEKGQEEAVTNDALTDFSNGLLYSLECSLTQYGKSYLTWFGEVETEGFLDRYDLES